MNKTLKLLLASVITVSATAAMASDNWQNGDGALNWKNGDGTFAGVITAGLQQLLLKVVTVHCNPLLLPLLVLAKAKSLCKLTHSMTSTSLI